VADSWQQVGLLLVTGFNCGYVLSFSNLMMVPLGWWWGAACLLLVAGAAWYANWLLAGLHLVDGHRFIRYRDLMGYVFGTYACIRTPRLSSRFNSSRSFLPQCVLQEKKLLPSFKKSYSTLDILEQFFLERRK
jgi:hypothetical protein